MDGRWIEKEHDYSVVYSNYDASDEKKGNLVQEKDGQQRRQRQQQHGLGSIGPSDAGFSSGLNGGAGVGVDASLGMGAIADDSMKINVKYDENYKCETDNAILTKHEIDIEIKEVKTESKFVIEEDFYSELKYAAPEMHDLKRTIKMEHNYAASKTDPRNEKEEIEKGQNILFCINAESGDSKEKGASSHLILSKEENGSSSSSSSSSKGGTDTISKTVNEALSMVGKGALPNGEKDPLSNCDFSTLKFDGNNDNKAETQDDALSAHVADDKADFKMGAASIKVEPDEIDVERVESEWDVERKRFVAKGNGAVNNHRNFRGKNNNNDNDLKNGSNNGAATTEFKQCEIALKADLKTDILDASVESGVKYEMGADIETEILWQNLEKDPVCSDEEIIDPADEDEEMINPADEDENIVMTNPASTTAQRPRPKTKGQRPKAKGQSPKTKVVSLSEMYEMMKGDGKTWAEKRKKDYWHLARNNLSKSSVLLEKELVQLNKIQEGGYTCNHDQCVFRSVREIDFDRHIRNAHKPKPIGNIKECPHCDFKTTLPSTFDMHLKIHVGEKPFQCKLCDYKCLRKEGMKKHYKTHSHSPEEVEEENEQNQERAQEQNQEQEMYKCKLCDFKTVTESEFHIHCNTHVNPYSCHLCEFRSALKGSLARHLKIHFIDQTPEKKYECHLCDYKAPYHGVLKRHMKVHLNKKYQCIICNLKYSKRKFLETHLKTHRMF